MEITVLLFGNLAQIAGVDKITLSDVNDTDFANELILAKYPTFKNSKYAIAVNKQLIKEKQILCDGDELVFLPPFSGG